MSSPSKHSLLQDGNLFDCLLTVDTTEGSELAAPLGYKKYPLWKGNYGVPEWNGGVIGYAWPNLNAAYTVVPVYRFFRNGLGHYYSTKDEAPPGYHKEQQPFYIREYNADEPPPPQQDFRKLDDYVHKQTGVHYYTTEYSDSASALENYYTFVGTVGWLWFAESPSKLPQGLLPVYAWRAANMFPNFTFDNTVSALDKWRLCERHAFALYRAALSDWLSPDEKEDVIYAYHNFKIRHEIVSGTDFNGHFEWESGPYTTNGQALIQIDPANIAADAKNAQPHAVDELTNWSMTLLHEMMHAAGYKHPKKTSNDRPLDMRVYYTTAPLRAEMAIAGCQS